MTAMKYFCLFLTVNVLACGPAAFAEKDCSTETNFAAVLSNKNSKLEKKSAELEKTIATLNDDLAKSQAAVTASSANVDDLQKQLDGYRHTSTELSSQIAALEASLTGTKDANSAAIEEKTAELMKTITRLEGDLAEAKAASLESSNKITSLEGELESSIADNVGKITALEAALTAAKIAQSDSDTLVTQISALESQLEETTKLSSQSSAKITVLEDALEAAKIAQSDSESMIAEIAALKKQVQQTHQDSEAKCTAETTKIKRSLSQVERDSEMRKINESDLKAKLQAAYDVLESAEKHWLPAWTNPHWHKVASVVTPAVAFIKKEASEGKSLEYIASAYKLAHEKAQPTMKHYKRKYKEYHGYAEAELQKEQYAGLRSTYSLGKAHTLRMYDTVQVKLQEAQKHPTVVKVVSSVRTQLAAAEQDLNKLLHTALESNSPGITSNSDVVKYVKLSVYGIMYGFPCAVFLYLLSYLRPKRVTPPPVATVPKKKSAKKTR